MKRSLPLVDSLWKSYRYTKWLWRAAYWISYQASKFFFLRFSGAKHVYVKGSYVSGEYEPLISDIDFVLVFEKNLDKGIKRARFWRKFCPVIKDADCFSEESFYLRRKYGSLKYENLANWRKLDNKYVRPASRPYMPLKSEFDRAQELFFYWEWIHYNLDIGVESDYRLRCAQRALEKAYRLYEPELEVAFANNPNEILSNLESLADKARKNSAASDRLAAVVALDTSEILKREWYRNRFHIYENDPSYRSGKMNMSLSTFRYFYSMGIVDSAVLINEIIPKEEPKLAAALALEYYLNLEEGRYNSVHSKKGQNIDPAPYIEILEKNNEEGESARFQHVYKLGDLKEGMTYMFLVVFSGSVEAKVHARLENCHSDDLVFDDLTDKNGQRVICVNFYSFQNFKNASLSLTSTISSFSSFKIEEFTTNSIKEEAGQEWVWAGEKKVSDPLALEGSIDLRVEGNFSPSWHKAVFKVEGASNEFRVDAFYPGGERMSSSRIQQDPSDYLTFYFYPGSHIESALFKLAVNEKVRYCEVVCFKLIS